MAYRLGHKFRENIGNWVKENNSNYCLYKLNKDLVKWWPVSKNE